MTIRWTKERARVWRGDNGMILLDQSFSSGGARIKCFFVYENEAALNRGENFASGDSVAEAKRKAGEWNESR